MGEGGEDISVLPYPSVQFVSKMLYRGQILTVWRPVEWDNVMVSQTVYDKLWLPRAGHYHAVKSFDIVAGRGTTTGRKTIFLYLTVKLPSITIKCDFTAWEMPPKTIIKPLLNLSLSTTAKKSETGMVSKKDPSPAPHGKSSGESAVSYAMRRVRGGNTSRLS